MNRARDQHHSKMCPPYQGFQTEFKDLGTKDQNRVNTKWPKQNAYDWVQTWWTHHIVIHWFIGVKFHVLYIKQAFEK
jgi:hypothetical protein